jgi:Transglutaminase-like superfamily
MRPARLFLTILFLAFVALPAGGVDVPQWLADVALLEIPAHSPETEAMVLLDERNITVDMDGTIHTVGRRAVKVLRLGGIEEARRLVLANAFDTKVRSMTAWNVTGGLKTLKVTMKNAIETGLAPDTLYTDIGLKILLAPSVEVGTLVGFEWEEERKPSSLEDIYEFQGSFPVKLSRYSVVLPAPWTVDAFWINWPPTEGRPVKGPPAALVWETANIPAIEEEPLMPSLRALAGRLVVRFKAGQPDSRCFSGWADMGTWYEALSKECRIPGQALMMGARELVKDAPDTFSRLRALAEFVQKKVRYVAIEIGIGGYKPHTASSVLTNLYGDCKDKATLLAALLQASGVDSYYLIVNTGNGVVTPATPVSLYSFNHAVLAIRLPEDVADTGMTAVVHHPRLGRLLVFDPTSPYTPLGRLPVYLQGNIALLVAEGSGELISLPLPPPEANLLDRKGRFVLGADGTLEGEIEEIRRGTLADATRQILLDSTDLERTKYVETFLANFFAGFSVQSNEIKNLHENSQDLLLDYRFIVPNYAKSAGGMTIVRPRVVGDKREQLETNENKPRRYAIDFNGVSEQRDEFTIELAEGFRVESLPPAADVGLDFGAYKSRTEQRDRSLIYRREYRLTQPLLPAGRYEEAVRFFKAMDADQRQSVLLKN